MLHISRGDPENGANENHDGEDRGRSKLSPGLQIPKNRSTGNLAVIGDSSERARIRFSFDAGAAAAEYDSLTRSPIMTDHDHGLGLSGLRRIRQHQPIRNPTLPSPSNPSSRSPSVSLPRSASMTMMWQHGRAGGGFSVSPGPASPTFTEDLSRFPSESLHSFSFANQSEELLHSRQNVLKRSLEFMRAPTSSSIAIASAQARASGDFEAQNALELLAQARLVGAGNLPNRDPDMPPGPLTGPAEVSEVDFFDKQFVPRSTSPEPLITPSISPTTTRRPGSSEPSHLPVTEAEPKHDPRVTGGGTSESPDSSRTPTNESGATAQTAQTSQTSPPPSRRPSSLKRTLTDTAHASIQQKLMDAMAQPYVATHAGEAVLSPTTAQSFATGTNFPGPVGSAVHGHATRWVPAAQAIFTTEAKPPWTILAANDLACLVFGVTKAEVRKMGILEVVQEERRTWLEKKLKRAEPDEAGDGSESEAQPAARAVSSSLLGSRGGGITAHLLSKPNSRAQKSKSQQQGQKLGPPQAQAQGRRPQTVHSGDPRSSKASNHHGNTSRGVLLCGDVVPIQKRNGALGSASLWVKEKRVGLIWVLEEIHEDVATVTLDDDGQVTQLEGSLGPIWGDGELTTGMDVGKLIPRIPRQGIDPRFGEIDYAQVNKRRFFTCRNCGRVNIPASVEQIRGKPQLRVSSFPHIAGIIVVCPRTLKIKSSNSVFCAALFGHEKPDGRPINELVPDFDKILRIVTEEDGLSLTDGIVVPEHSFRKASAFLALREGRPDAATSFLRPEGLPARHRDGSELKIDVQMRVVKSEKQQQQQEHAAPVIREEAVLEVGEASGDDDDECQPGDLGAPGYSEVVYALWITYSRHLHASRANLGSASPLLSGTATPLHQPSPGQTPAHTPQEISSDADEPKKDRETSISKITQQIKDVARGAAAKIVGVPKTAAKHVATASVSASEAKESAGAAPPRRKTLEDFVILEEMGQGAYGQVKLARYKDNGHKVVLKYVTKRRILVDTWTRDRRLGTVPLEIHVLDYLRRDGFRHPNIVEMEDFFEDAVNYYIEMAPHGLPGMDLFDYIELRANMEEDECRSIFVQVARAVHHLHTVALVVHRDIKDENVILDGDGNIKLIDFGSAAYIKSGPFDVFVGTIDYAAPEVLGGQPYGGKEQDVWALGILLYTIIYKENPFYSIDEIMDRDLRVPYTISDESIDLIRHMLDRDVKQRYQIDQVLNHPWCQDVPAG